MEKQRIETTMEVAAAVAKKMGEFEWFPHDKTRSEEVRQNAGQLAATVVYAQAVEYVISRSAAAILQGQPGDPAELHEKLRQLAELHRAACAGLSSSEAQQTSASQSTPL